MVRWVALVAAAILWAGGCELGDPAEKAVAKPLSVAGCWSVPESMLNADFSAIVLRLDAAPRPSGAETLRGTLAFVTGESQRFSVHGEYQPGNGSVDLVSESFQTKGVATTSQIMMKMIHYDDLEELDITFQREGKGCQVN